MPEDRACNPRMASFEQSNRGIVGAERRTVLVRTHDDVEAADVVHEPGYECLIGIRGSGLAREHVRDRCDQRSLAPQSMQPRAQHRVDRFRHLLYRERHRRTAHQLMAEAVYGLLQVGDRLGRRIEERGVGKLQYSHRESRVDADHAGDLGRSRTGILEGSLHALCNIRIRWQANVTVRQLFGQALEEFRRD